MDYEDVVPKAETSKVKETTVDYLVNGDTHYLTATEWKNGDGWTVSIEGTGVDIVFQLHVSDFSALNLVIETLNLSH